MSLLEAILFLAVAMTLPAAAIVAWVCWVLAHLVLAVILGGSIAINCVLAWLYWRVRHPRIVKLRDDDVHGDVPHVGRGV